MKRNDYKIFASDTNDNRTLLFSVLGERTNDGSDPLHFKLRYTPPYSEFNGIIEFRQACAYRPFRDDPIRSKTLIIDLAEWAEHADEEYLEHFFAYLHDYDGYYEFDYVFSTGSSDERFAREVNMLAALYLGTGAIVTNMLGKDERILGEYIRAVYRVSDSAALKLAELFNESERFKGLTAIDGVMSDLIENAGRHSIRLDDAAPKQLSLQLQNKCPMCKLLLFFEKEIISWQHEPSAHPNDNVSRISEVV